MGSTRGKCHGPFDFLQARRLPGDILRAQSFEVGGQLLRTTHVGQLVVDRVVELDQVIGLPGLVLERTFGKPRHAIRVKDVDLQDLLRSRHQIEISVAVEILRLQEVHVSAGLLRLQRGDVPLRDGDAQRGRVGNDR